LELCSECCNRGHTIFLLASAVQFCDLVTYHLGFDAPRHFHFKIKALTVDQGSSSRAEIWDRLVGKIASYHGTTLKVRALQYRPFYCQCWPMEIAWQCAQFYTLVCNGCGWNS
jgi:hypothetical protein